LSRSCKWLPMEGFGPRESWVTCHYVKCHKVWVAKKLTIRDITSFMNHSFVFFLCVLVGVTKTYFLYIHTQWIQIFVVYLSIMHNKKHIFHYVSSLNTQRWCVSIVSSMYSKLFAFLNSCYFNKLLLTIIELSGTKYHQKCY